MANTELMIFAACSFAVSGIMLFSRKLEYQIMMGVIGFVSWFVTAQYFMASIITTNPDFVVFGHFFQLFGVLSMVIAVSLALQSLNPYRVEREEYE